MLGKENKHGKEADVGSNLDAAPSQLCDFSNFLAAVLTPQSLHQKCNLSRML